MASWAGVGAAMTTASTVVAGQRVLEIGVGRDAGRRGGSGCPRHGIAHGGEEHASRRRQRPQVRPALAPASD